MRKAQWHRHMQGFTLIELLVVLALMGVVFSIALPRLTGAVAERNVRNARAAVANLYAKARVHAVQRRVPATLRFSGTVVLITVPKGAGLDTLGALTNLGDQFQVAVQVSGGPVVIAPNGLVRSGLPLRAVFTRAGRADTLQLSGYGQVQ